MLIDHFESSKNQFSVTENAIQTDLTAAALVGGLQQIGQIVDQRFTVRIQRRLLMETERFESDLTGSFGLHIDVIDVLYEIDILLFSEEFKKFPVDNVPNRMRSKQNQSKTKIEQ